MKNVMSKIAAFTRDVRGATAIEYALIAGIICLSIVAGATTLGGSANASFARVNDGVWKN